MNNYVILKWGSLKAYNFTDKFIKDNKEIVKEFENIWNKIYENHCSATGGSEEVHKNNDLKNKMLNVLEELYKLNVLFENGWTDEYYNNFDEIKALLDYITNLQEELKYQKEAEFEYNKKHTKLMYKYKQTTEKIDKAIKYLEEPNRDNFDYSKAYLLNILGDDKE